jgi:putative DNA primase/helicase
MSAMHDIAVSRKFLDEWFAGMPGQAYSLSWRYGGEGGAFVSAARTTLSELGELAEQHMIAGASDVWFRTTTMIGVPEDGRGKAIHTAACPGVWGDLDIAGVGHKRQACRGGEGCQHRTTGGKPVHRNPVLPDPADEVQALAIIDAAGYPEPTMLVHTGGGLAPYWKLTAPITDQAQAAELSKTWHDGLQATARRLGLHVDTAVRDMARVLRLPGSINGKVPSVPRPVMVLRQGGPTYTAGQLHAAAAAAVGRSKSAPRGEQAPGIPPVPMLAEAGPRGALDPDEHDASWMHARLDMQLGRLRALTGSGQGWNNTLNEAALVFGHAVPCGVVTEDQARELLKAECTRVFGEPDSNDRGTIDSGLRYGMAQPWKLRPAHGSPTPDREVGEYQLPSPQTPAPAARAIHERFTGSGRLLWFWRGDWYMRAPAHWTPVEVAQVRTWIYTETEAAFYMTFNDKTEQWERKAWNPAPQRVNATLDALQHTVAYRPGHIPEDRCMALQNGVFDLGTGQLLPHEPSRFNLTSLPFAFAPAAACPVWLAFLAEQIPDAESRQLLCEFAGYLVSGRTDLQKILHLYGVRRGGKGTVARVFEALIGPDNTASVTLKSLTGAFGEQPLIGKSLAMVTDANWKVRDVETAVEALKSISGEDSRDVNRKHRETWHGKLGARFVILGNDEPEFKDASGALLGRMIHIYFGRSVFGREDPTLTSRLIAELPGIFNWSLDGLRALTARGHLTVPGASRESERDIARSTSPVAGFIEDRIAIMDPAVGAAAWLDDLYAAYTAWCIDNGQRFDLHKTQFAKALRSACSGQVEVRRERRTAGNPQPRYYGLALSLGQAGAHPAGMPPVLRG